MAAFAIPPRLAQQGRLGRRGSTTRAASHMPESSTMEVVDAATSARFEQHTSLSLAPTRILAGAETKRVGQFRCPSGILAHAARADVSALSKGVRRLLVEAALPPIKCLSGYREAAPVRAAFRALEIIEHSLHATAALALPGLKLFPSVASWRASGSFTPISDFAHPDNSNRVSPSFWTTHSPQLCELCATKPRKRMGEFKKQGISQEPEKVTKREKLEQTGRKWKKNIDASRAMRLTPPCCFLTMIAGRAV